MKRRFWQVYLFVMGALLLGGIVLSIVNPPDDPREIYKEIILLPLYIAQLVGLFGYIRSRAIGARVVWQLVFAVSVIEEAWALSSIFNPSMPEVEPIFRIALASVMSVIVLPLFVALYLYGFHRKELWAR